MIASVCPRLISPAFVKLTTITVVALLLWTSAVTTMPVSRPSSRLSVTRPRMARSRLPAICSSPVLVIRMPVRKRASPPSSPDQSSSVHLGSITRSENRSTSAGRSGRRRRHLDRLHAPGREVVGAGISLDIAGDRQARPGILQRGSDRPGA